MKAIAPAPAITHTAHIREAEHNTLQQLRDLQALTDIQSSAGVYPVLVACLILRTGKAVSDITLGELHEIAQEAEAQFIDVWRCAN